MKKRFPHLHLTREIGYRRRVQCIQDPSLLFPQTFIFLYSSILFIFIIVVARLLALTLVVFTLKKLKIYFIHLLTLTSPSAK